jgi:sarcosine oxidase subunit beta
LLKESDYFERDTAGSRDMILIVGAGVIGASVAWHLARRGLQVRVIDRAPALGGGSTSKATGGFRAQFASEIDVRLSLLSRDSLRTFDSGYQPYGYLFLARTAAELDDLRAAQTVQHACGLAEARMVDAREARELNPAIEDDSLLGGAFCPTDGFIRPMNILRHYVDGARALGAELTFDCEWLAWVRDGDRIVAARTSRGDLEAAMFVNAAGAWSGAPVVPLRRNVAATADTDLLPESMPMTIWAGDWYHLRVRDGRVLLLWPDTPAVDDATWLATVMRMTRERVPRVAALPIAETWSGFYEMTPDEHPLLGRAPGSSNLFLATGCSGHGVMHSPAIGQLIAELIVDGKTSIDVSALDPRRFA